MCKLTTSQFMKLSQKRKLQDKLYIKKVNNRLYCIIER